MKLDLNERSDDRPEWLKDITLNVDELWQYPVREPLEQTIAKELSQCCAANFSAANIFCSNGGDESIYILMRLIKETARVILPLPAFSQYTQGLESWALDGRTIAANEDLSINLDAVIDAISEQPGSVVILTSPNNPTGELVTLNALKQVLDAAAANQSWVFFDEAYIEFSEQKSAIELIEEYDNLVVLRTLSKAFGLAGIRFGYLAANARLIELFKQRAMPFNIPAPSLQIAKEAMSQRAQQDVKRFVTRIQQNRAELFQWFKQRNLQPFPSHSNFLLIPMPLLQADLLTQVLKRKGIAVRRFNDDELKSCVRITIPFYLTPLIDALEDVFDPQLLCFDMDGVLIDTSSSYDEAIAATVKKFSGKAVERATILAKRRQGGFNNDWVLSQSLIAEAQGNAVALEPVIDYFQSVYLGSETNPGCIANETAILNQDAAQAINTLNVRTAIVTGRPRYEAKLGSELLQKTLKVWQPSAIVSTDDVTDCKPSPEGILGLKQAFNANRSWMFGDTPDDMQAARRSNSIAIGIGQQNQQQLRAAGADLVIDNINQIIDLLTATESNERLG
ncbi:MAG: aminotransferase class I/II-fold pyridoxal phosphate-dependent enzyme [Gammaproteobacteria bacterium]|nr:aminotransferase class I/II-fold pyridoxal phosphate-dependent enzyme [Gammaproteobacteria bacterium]